MVNEGRDKNDNETIPEALAKPGVSVGAAIVPKGGDDADDDAGVDVAVAVAADMALTGV